MLRVDKMPWLEKAACRGLPASIFFPDIVIDGEPIYDDGITTGNGRGTSRGEDRLDTAPYYAEAKSICFACPVRRECLEHALVTHEAYGMFGGKTPLERLREIRNRNRHALNAERAKYAS